MADIGARLLHAPAWDNTLPSQVFSTMSNVTTTPLTGGEITSATISRSDTDGIFTDTKVQSLVRFPLLINLPPAALVIHDNLHPLAAFHLYVPTARAHPRSPLAVWSNTEVNLLSAPRFTCKESAIHPPQCQANAVSHAMVKKSDVKDKDSALPPDALTYLFASDIGNTPLSAFKRIAWKKMTNCKSLPTASPFIWIDGHCEITAGKTLGSPNSPALIIVRNGDIQLHSNTRMYGLVVSYREKTKFTQRVLMAPDAAIVGSLVLNHPASADSAIQVMYDFAVLSTLRSLPALQQISLVPGSVQ